jgi:hypothetical protein
MLSISGILTGCFFSFFFITQLLEFSATSKREREGQLIFPGVMWLRGVYLLAILMGFTIMVGCIKKETLIGRCCFAYLFCAHRIFRLAKGNSNYRVRDPPTGPLLTLRKITNNEIQSVVLDASRKDTVVFGKNGVRIVHTMMHSDKERFIEQVESIQRKEAVILGAKT